MQRILIALGFLTTVPVRVKEITKDDLARSMVYFPLIGLFIGSILVLVNRGAILFFPPLVANLLIVITLVILTGAFHLDGLADTLDGFYAGRTKEEILNIMRDSMIGVMGVTGIVLVLLAKWAGLSEMSPLVKDGALLLAPTLGRCSVVLAAFLSPYARETEGTGKPFAHQVKASEFCIAALFTLIASLTLFKISGLILFLIVVLIVVGFTKKAKKKIGGMTGDLFGFLCETVEVLTIGGLVCLNHP